VTKFLSSARLAAACLGLALAALVPPALAQGPDEEKITVNFVNADIQSVIKTVGQHTGRNFILDPRVTGTVNIVSDRPVSKELLYQIFLSALRVQGYAAVEEGNFVKIVPEAEAKTSGGPFGEQAQRLPGDRVITQVFMLQHENAAQLIPVLRPLVTANNYIAAYPNNNAIIITDYAENVRRIQRIIAAIDLPPSGDVQIIRLANASAIDVAQILQRVIPETGVSPAAPGIPPKAALAVDPRTNSLLVRGDNPALLTRIKALAASLDTPGAGAGNIFVVPLRNAEAARIAEVLRALLAGGDTSRVSTTTTASPLGPTTTAPASLTATTTTSTPVASVIQAYQPTNSLIITASEPVYRNLRSVIDKLDERRLQVYVEALIVEVSTGLAAEFGIQWNAARNIGGGQTAFGGTNFSTTIGSNILGAASDPTTLGNGLNLGIIKGTIKIPGTDVEIANLQLLARALEGDSGANVLSTPNVLTLDNEEAKIVVGQNVPFITGSYTPVAGTANNPFQTIERKDIGITLRVTPQVSEAGAVKLKIYQEVSSVTRDKALVQSSDIITNKRSLESTVLVDDGQIVVLGGLIQDDQQASVDKVPLLGDIPYLGALFKYETRNRKRTNLMVFLRPVVLKDDRGAQAITAERYDFIRGQQGQIRLPWNVLLPETRATPLPPLEEEQKKPLGTP